ncbi:Ribosomal protein lysine methyltransferase [Marasmius tenuissimus]|uniref:Ribosomal protein lysine methyltransferase n=1 Tax=Marasmius tenuissimus TaxID=585030 RepID=A0ABR2ZZ54_9AGAR
MTSFQSGLLALPPESEQVTDADEEIFLLYADLQSHTPSAGTGATSFRGLGHIDSHKDELIVVFELNSVTSPSVQVPSPSRPKKDSRRTRKSGKNIRSAQSLEVEVRILQDKTALRTRKGDTGSVLWHASVDFARLILQQIHFPDPTAHSLVDRDKLKECHILELGAGTGLLGIVLSPLIRKYTITDIDDLVPLIKKNVQLNVPEFPKDSNLVVTSLDWVTLQQVPPSKRPEVFAFDPVDLVLVVDCIYHPSLLPSLLETLNFLAIPGTTTVLVVVELRASDVVTEFLQSWITMPCWEVWRIADNGTLMGRPYAMWAGRKATSLP